LKSIESPSDRLNGDAVSVVKGIMHSVANMVKAKAPLQ